MEKQTKRKGGDVKKRKRRAVPRSLWAACDGKHTSKRFLLHLLPGFLFSFYFSKHTFPSYFLSSSNLVPFPLPHYCVVEDLRGRNLGCTTRWCEEERLGTDKKKQTKKCRVTCLTFCYTRKWVGSKRENLCGGRNGETAWVFCTL